MVERDMSSVSADGVPDRIEVRLPQGSRVLICSDLRLGESSTEASLLVASELATRVRSWSGPGAVVLNGNCFELLASTGPSVAGVLAAHHDFEEALRDFAGGPDRRVIVTVGNHDGRIAWDPASAATLRQRLDATIAITVDLLVDTTRGVRVVRVEHGHQFDPANSFRDPHDPFDTPLGHHLVQEVLPDMAERSFLGDVSWLADPNEFRQFLGSRIVYRELFRHAWWLSAPFLIALLIRTPIVAQLLSRRNDSQPLGRLLLAVGVGAAVDAAVLALLVVLIARRVFRSLAKSRLGPRGTHSNDVPRAAGEALCAQGFAGIVTGHTHRPELTPFVEGFYANSGCGVQVVEASPARAGLPPVFTGVLRRSWVELESGRDLEARLFVAETPVVGVTRLERLAMRRRVSRSSQPTIVSSIPGGAGWPISHVALQSTARRRTNRRIASTAVLLVSAMGVASAVTPPLRGRLRGVLEIMPVEVPQAASAALVFGSLALVILARGLRRGHRLAWLATLGLLGASAILHLVKGGDLEEAVAVAAIAAWLGSRAPDFPVRTDAGTIRRSAVLALAVGGSAVAISFVLVSFFGAHRRSDVSESLRALTERLAGDQVIPLPGELPFVTPALTATGIGIMVVVASLVLGPRRRRVSSPSARVADAARARAIVEQCGGDTLTYFALRDDKDWFFTASSLVAYSVRNGVCLVSPDPVGPVQEWADTWAEFSAFADRNGWSLAVVGAQPGWLAVYEASGMLPIYMGDEAIVDCQAFSLAGGTMKGLRGAYNRVKKAGYTTVFLDPANIDPALEADLRDLMTETRHGETERGFSMTLSRIFDPNDTGLLLSVALDTAGRPAAFCQWVPAADIDGWSLDLMRRRADPDLPNGVTDFVVIETIEHVKASHQWGVGLNFAVLRAVVSGEREGGFYALQRRVLHKFSETMQIESLWRYNEKFHPYWRPRYVVLDSVEHAAAQGTAIADAESIWELPVIGRFLGRRS